MGSRSKKDRVDLLLIGELRQEEKAWTVYDEDEDFVMANLTESIFDLLIDDTIQALRDVEAKRLQCWFVFYIFIHFLTIFLSFNSVHTSSFFECLFSTKHATIYNSAKNLLQFTNIRKLSHNL